MRVSRKVVISRYGGPDVLEIAEIPVPEPKPGEVLIRNMATTVSIGDVWIRSGQLALPFRKKAPKSPVTPGSEVVGIVEKIGAGVSAFRLGQLVAALTVSGGGYSEHACLDQNEIVAVPDGIEPDDVACLTLNYVLAYRMLHQAAKVRKGESIVVLGASGSIGTALLQLGKVSGLDMVGTASRTKHDFISSLSAVPIDYRHKDFIQEIKSIHPDGVNAVFDGAASDIGKSYSLLRRNGRLIVYGFVSPQPKQMLPRLMRLLALRLVPDGKKAAFYSLLLAHRKNPQVWKEDMAVLFQLLRDKSIQPVIAHRFPIESIRSAHETLERGAVPGRIILTMNS
ncbi:zinc-binding dehydrogenase [Paenibacillus nasutitermitis]|uniref:NADPH:quinone reductase n=1 Tax=Paenibacillus nasutitermitis TaxID=1652958 RepID=A0A916YUE2_9BACL|nr:zinc-binding dehydrogenase [Paenibacillus nasutitermitis]GGD60793.1 NADPH:quinone reductase [Paenibacillus nasutitermitis]